MYIIIIYIRNQDLLREGNINPNDFKPETNKNNPSAPEEYIIVTDPEKDRYNTFRFISWWDQEIVHNSRVLVIGAGALGNEVLKNLALMGIGEISIVDFDTIEDANLSRSVLFRASDNGKRKAEVAARMVKEINPDVKVQWLNRDINHGLGLGVYRRMDAIIGCLDNRLARLSINQACWKLNKPWIDGAIQELLGIARVFRPNDGACYECIMTDEDYKIIHQRTSCPDLARRNTFEGKVPTTPTISSIIGAIQTQDALKLIHGMSVKAGIGYVFNGLENDFFEMTYSIKEDCPSHEVWENIQELPEAYSDTTTLGDILKIVKNDLGEEARFVLPEFVLSGKCFHCGYTTIFKKPKHQLYEENGLCPECGDHLKLDILYYGENGLNDEILNLPLSRVGFPELAIIEAINSKYESRYYEVSGDDTKFFNFV
jgi:adenylyltransferase/sulfurtransferase